MHKRTSLLIAGILIIGIALLVCFAGCDIIEDSESGDTLTIDNLKDAPVTVIIVKDDGSSMYVREWRRK